jgi:transposase
VKRNKYRRINAEEKIKALQKHLMKKEQISEICQNLDIQPSIFYGWQRDLFARGAVIFEKKPGQSKRDNSDDKIAALEAKLAKKDQVIAELLEEHVALKKSLGVS